MQTSAEAAEAVAKVGELRTAAEAARARAEAAKAAAREAEQDYYRAMAELDRARRRLIDTPA